MKDERFIMLTFMRNFKCFAIIFLCAVALFAYAAEVVYRIDIEGNEIVSDATIVSKIKIRAGQEYNENIVNEDIKNLYATGFFENVEAEKKYVDDGVAVVIKVKEKPVVKALHIEGQRYIREKQILEAIDIKEGSFVDDYRLKESVRKIKDLYAQKGFSQAEAGYEIVPLEKENEAEVKFSISEKGLLKVRRVDVEGNESFSDGRIRKIMKTRKAWLFNRGLFKEEVMEDDLKRISDFYKSQGFSDVVVRAEKGIEPKGVYITIYVNEGQRYYIGEINIEGNEKVESGIIEEAIALKEGDVFSEQGIYQNSSSIRQVYVDRGYIFSQVEPIAVYNSQTEKVDITYKISESDVAYVEDLIIRGNTKTKDKVIRREMRVYPGEKFDGKKVRRSKEKLENLGFFEEIRFSTEPGSGPNEVDLVVDVKEAKTGYLSFGGGYSSIDEFIGFAELRQRNFDYKNFSTFTGAGQDLSLMVSLGTLTDRYQLSFTNPWIFDRPVSFGFDGYKKGHKRDENVGYAYEEDIRGGALRLEKEFSDRVKGGVAYRYERVEISDVIDDATTELKDEAGITNLSSTELSFQYDTRDNVFVPSRGIYFVNTVQLTGSFLGGDRDFTKNFSRLSLYFPAINKSVVELKLRTGFGDPFSDTDKIPIYERYFAGGASTVRGYRERKVGPIDKATEDPIGGEAMFIGNIEYTYPLADFLKVATFFDTGNVWAKNEDFLSGDLFSSVGLGIRIKTPIGPVSVDYGWPLDLEPGEESKEGRFHFNVTRAF